MVSDGHRRHKIWSVTRGQVVNVPAGIRPQDLGFQENLPNPHYDPPNGCPITLTLLLHPLPIVSHHDGADHNWRYAAIVDRFILGEGDWLMGAVG